MEKAHELAAHPGEALDAVGREREQLFRVKAAFRARDVEDVVDDDGDASGAEAPHAGDEQQHPPPSPPPRRPPHPLKPMKAPPPVRLPVPGERGAGLRVAGVEGIARASRTDVATVAELPPRVDRGRDDLMARNSRQLE